MTLRSLAASGRVQLPARFTPTHQTSGLPGYPAIDCFGPSGSVVVAGFYGRVRRLSGRDCILGGVPGGAYGRSMYITNYAAGIDRYLTHLDELLLSVGAIVWPGRALATICDSAVSGKPGTSHVHYGCRRP